VVESEGRGREQQESRQGRKTRPRSTEGREPLGQELRRENGKGNGGRDQVPREPGPRDEGEGREGRQGRFDMEVDVTVDRATEEWQGAVGVVTKLIDRAPFDPGSAIAFACGPEIMIRFAVMALQQRGVAPSSVYVSMERNMKCAVGLCGHCQFGPLFVCKDGPVFRYDKTLPFFGMREA
jgi:hypothetical protein